MVDDFTTFASQLTGVLSTIFWISLGVAILVRVIIAIRRRRAGNIKRDILKPFARSGAVLSEIYGWKPSNSQVDLQVAEQTEVYRIHPTGPHDADEQDNRQ